MINFLIKQWNNFFIWKHRRYVNSQINAGMFIGKNVMITPGVLFDPPHSFLTSIGDDCIIAPDVRFLNHDASLFGFKNFARIGIIDIKENCFIGAGTILLPGITIGPNSVIAAGSVVVKDIPENTIAAGNPAKPIKKVDEFLELNLSNLENGTIPSFESDVFYKKLSDRNYLEEVKVKLVNGIGYTVGTDNDLTYHFNLTEKDLKQKS